MMLPSSPSARVAPRRHPDAWVRFVERLRCNSEAEAERMMAETRTRYRSPGPGEFALVTWTGGGVAVTVETARELVRDVAWVTR